MPQPVIIFDPIESTCQIPVLACASVHSYFATSLSSHRSAAQDTLDSTTNRTDEFNSVPSINHQFNHPSSQRPCILYEASIHWSFIQMQPFLSDPHKLIPTMKCCRLRESFQVVFSIINSLTVCNDESRTFGISSMGNLHYFCSLSSKIWSWMVEVNLKCDLNGFGVTFYLLYNRWIYMILNGSRNELLRSTKP